MRPTEAGMLMIEYAYREIFEYHRVRDEIQDVNNLEGGRVTMGISTFRETFLLLSVLSEFRKQYLGIHVNIVEENSMALEQILQNGTIDISLIILSAKTLRHNIEILMRDEIGIITNENHSVLESARNSPVNSNSRIPKYVDLRDAV